MRPNPLHGFTLIELSIVLVIIGLLAGGVLVGRDLIAGARLRAQVSQIEKYNTAVNTFRLKYGYIPGDMPSAAATQFGLFATTGAIANTRGNGDGNRLLEGGVQESLNQVAELLIFWRHLTEAQLIEGTYGTAASGNAIVAATGAMTAATIDASTAGQIFPPGKIGRSNYLFVYSYYGINFYQLSGVAYMADTGVFEFGPVAGLPAQITPIEAQSIDGKTDDGFPFTGNTIALTDDLEPNRGGGAPCTTGTSYDVGATNGNSPSCQLRLKLN